MDHIYVVMEVDDEYKTQTNLRAFSERQSANAFADKQEDRIAARGYTKTEIVIDLVPLYTEAK